MTATSQPDCKFIDAKVLIAEDNDFSLEVLKHMLSLFGIEADLAVDGVEAVEKAKKKEYDLCILDIHMPNKDGNEAAREIRKLPSKQPVIVALTASVFESEKQATMQAGFDDYYNKPLELSGLQAMLMKHLKSKMVE